MSPIVAVVFTGLMRKSLWMSANNIFSDVEYEKRNCAVSEKVKVSEVLPVLTLVIEMFSRN